eukprot:4167163-Pyramimonas_sp.AAC.1
MDGEPAAYITSKRMKVAGGTAMYFGTDGAQDKRDHSEYLTAEDIANWPDTATKLIFDRPDGHLRRRRIEAMLSNGTVLTSDFSGRMSAEVAWSMLMVALRKCGLDLPATDTLSWSACDNASVPQKIMTTSRGAMAPRH